MRRGKEDADGDVARGECEGFVEGVEGCVVEGEEGLVEGGYLSIWQGEDFFGGAVAEGRCLGSAEYIYRRENTEGK